MVDLEVRCNNCEQDLNAELKTYGRNNSIALFIEPCEKCMEEAKKDGYDEGTEDAKEVNPNDTAE
mgnify:CR=1 FL=1